MAFTKAEKLGNYEAMLLKKKSQLELNEMRWQAIHEEIVRLEMSIKVMRQELQSH